LNFKTWVSNKNQISNQGDFPSENKYFKILLPDFSFELESNSIQMKADAFYSQYKSKAIHLYKNKCKAA
jgi:hypothetical protein